jgi:cytochrome c553
MKARIGAILSVCGIVAAQDAASILRQGEEVFAKSCGSAYCHGTRGAGGGAPRLAARGFDQTYISNTVSRGLPGTSMAAFNTSLSRAELAAVVGYVASLNGITQAGASSPGDAAPNSSLSETARLGHDLFFDSLRGFGRCSTCHEVSGMGIPIASPIAKVPADARSLRSLATPAVKTATLDHRTMPALSISIGSRVVIFYDLTSAPPVQHRAEPGAVVWNNSSDWRHSAFIQAYSDGELTSVLAFLREVTQ